MNLINSTNTSPHSINASYGDVMSESTSTYYTNKSYLLDVIMKKLNISDEDLNKDTSWIKAKVRDLKLDEVLN